MKRNLIKILKLISELNEAEQKQLLAKISDTEASINSSEAATLSSCIFCGCKSLRLYGKYKNYQRYKCNKCCKLFTSKKLLTTYWTHYPDKWEEFIECMITGLSIAKTAKRLEISVPTAFQWRHKILKSYEKIADERLAGIIEADETFFLFSEKGFRSLKKRKPRKRGGKAKKPGISREQIPVIVGCDRNGHVILGVANGGRVSMLEIEAVLNDYIDEDIILCTDAHQSFQAYAKAYELKYVGLNISQGQRVYKKKYHIQNVNGFHSRLKKWMVRFNGVSTKYLQNYMNWFSLLEETKNEPLKQKLEFQKRLHTVD